MLVFAFFKSAIFGFVAGSYMYIEGNSATYGDSARLLSSECHYDGPLCLHLWYHIYGSASAMALNIYLLQDNRATKLNAIKNNHGPEWQEALVDLKESGPFQVCLTQNTDLTCETLVLKDGTSSLKGQMI